MREGGGTEMFISSMKMKGRPEKRNEILQTISGISDLIKLNKGCLSADCYQDINNENIYCLVDVWQTQQDLDEYLGSRLFVVLLGIKTLLVEMPEIKLLVEDCIYNCDGKKGNQVH